MTFVEKKRPVVFISHSSHDLQRLESELIDPMKKMKIEIWYCKQRVKYGQFQEKIRQGIETSDWFLLLVSRYAARSEWVKAEVHMACEYLKDRIIIIRMDQTKPEEIDIRLGPLHFLDMRDSAQNTIQAIIKIISDEKPDHGLIEKYKQKLISWKIEIDLMDRIIENFKNGIRFESFPVRPTHSAEEARIQQLSWALHLNNEPRKIMAGIEFTMIPPAICNVGGKEIKLDSPIYLSTTPITKMIWERIMNKSIPAPEWFGPNSCSASARQLNQLSRMLWENFSISAGIPFLDHWMLAVHVGLILSDKRYKEYCRLAGGKKKTDVFLLCSCRKNIEQEKSKISCQKVRNPSGTISSINLRLELYDERYG
jgi:hypothetical protein